MTLESTDQRNPLLVEKGGTMGRHWKSVNAWVINPPLSLYVWLMYRVRALLYGQWDQLAQFAMPLHFDMRFLVETGETKGHYLWLYQQNEKTLTHILLLDHVCLWLNITMAEQRASKVTARKCLSSNGLVLPAQEGELLEGNSWPEIATVHFEMKLITVQI